MPSLNKAIIMGHLGQDAAVRSLTNGEILVNFSVATTESWQKDGAWQHNTEWHNVSIFGKATEWVRDWKKGNLVYIEGKIEKKKYTDSEGNSRLAINIVVKPFGGVAKNLTRREDRDDTGEKAKDNDDPIPF